MTLTSPIAAADGIPRQGSRRAADALLSGSAGLWFVVALFGQWAFVYYIAAFYGPSSLNGNFEAWRKNTHLIKGYVPGDSAGNAAFAVHALLAGYVAFGGALQLIPQIRNAVPVLHRWNGRVFVLTALGLSLTGLYMVWVRGATFDTLNAIAVSLNGVLIILCAGIAWRAAVKRDFASHRRWAMRTWLVANGQWFIRIGVIAYVIVTQGHAKIGPFFRVWEFGCYLVPLAILELYLRAKDKGGERARHAMAAGLAVLALLTGAATAVTYMFIWRPYI